MSIRDVEQIVAELPYSIREDVVGYAHSVQAALPDIFRNARLPATSTLKDQIVLVAGVRKLHSIATSNFWILEHSLHLSREANLGAVRIAGETIHRRSDYYLALSRLMNGLNVLLGDLGIREYIEMDSYADIARSLSIGR